MKHRAGTTRSGCHTRAVRARPWLVMMLVIALGGWQPFKSADPDITAGNKAYEEERWSDAIQAYERARDMASVDRVRTLEVDRLVERGDRLGAVLLLVQARRREQAAKLLEPLPPPKAFRFLQQLGLDADAKALGERELQRATEESKSMARARCGSSHPAAGVCPPGRSRSGSPRWTRAIPPGPAPGRYRG